MQASSPAKSTTSSTGSLTPPSVILRTKSKYDPLLVGLLAFGILAVLVPLYTSLRDGDYQAAWVLIWSLLFVGGCYMLVLPKHLDVHSDGVIAVKTILTTWKFADVSRAYESSFSPDELMMPRIKFATAWKSPHRVILCRKHGKWDVIVSPVDAKEFVEAVNKLVNANDDDLVNAETGLNSPKPDLSSQ